jgi:HEAT repeat protein
MLAALVPIAVSAGAQIDTNKAVQRYNRVAKGSNVAEWHKRLFDDDVKVRLDAVDSLGGAGGSDDAVRALLDATADRDPRVRAKAIDALGEVGNPLATPVLTQYLFLNAVDRYLKQRILVALGRIADPASIERLADFAEETDDNELRCAALYALGEIGDARGLDVLKSYTGDDAHPDVQRIARDAVAKIKERVAALPNNQPTILELEKQLGPRQQQ